MVLTWNLSVYTIILVLFGLVVVWLTNLHSCLNISYMKDRRKGGEINSQTTEHNSFVLFFFPHPLSSSSLKVPAVSLPSFQRMTLSPMTRVTPTAAAVRAMTLTRRRFCWMSRWKGRPAPPTPTVQPRLLAPCSGQWETPPAREPLVVLPPAPQHQRVSLLYLWDVCLWFKTSVTKTVCVSLPVMFTRFVLSQQAPQGWYILTRPTYAAPVPSAPAPPPQQQRWRPATPAAIWHLPAAWLGPTALSSGRSQTSWVSFPSTTI